MNFWRHLFLVLSYAFCFSALVFAPGNFSIPGTTYNCSGNLICLGDAHILESGSPGGRSLSLTRTLVKEGDGSSGGIAYYNEPVRFMNPSSGQAASFSTSFSCYQVKQDLVNHGDGFTFVISASNSTSGEGGGGYFGFFNSNGRTDFKSVVVEFDSVMQGWAPIFDESANHVGFDFMNIKSDYFNDADDAQIFFFVEGAVYVWVEYKAETQTLEARVSNFSTRPASPFLSAHVNLSQYLEEYMWVGFSAGHGGGWSYYYIGDWTFESYGIPAEPGTEPEPSPTPRKKKSPGIVVGSIIGGFVAFVGLTLLAIFIQRRWGSPANGRANDQLWWKNGSRAGNLGGDNDAMMQMAGMGEGYRFSYEELKAATRDFSENGKLGQGGFGNVYRGVLPRSNLVVAVKQIKQESEQGEKAFKAEVSVISQVRHRNLIQLLGWCIEGGKYHIVYELMRNGSLDKYLFGPKIRKNEVLSWPLRWSIIQGTAAAVDYLHRGWKQQVIHRDIKASNILLDDKWNAKLGDFGLARVTDHQAAASTTDVAGTQGYIAPKALASGRFTDKSDVFAFGIVALEIACGRKSIALHLGPDEIILVDWVWRCLSAGDLSRVVDPDLSEYDRGQMESLLLMGIP